MNLLNLKEVIDGLNERINSQGDVKMQGTQNGTEGIPVVVELAEPSIGPMKTVEISYAGLGFDWNAGQFILFPKDKLVKEQFNRLTSRKVVKENDAKKICYCSSCMTIAGQSDQFCRKCGKKFLDD